MERRYGALHLTEIGYLLKQYLQTLQFVNLYTMIDFLSCFPRSSEHPMMQIK